MRPSTLSLTLRRIGHHVESGKATRADAIELLRKVAQGLDYDDERVLEDVDQLMKRGLPRDMGDESKLIKSNHPLHDADIYYTMDRGVWVEGLRMTLVAPDTPAAMEKLSHYKGASGAAALIVFGDMDFFIHYYRSDSGSELTAGTEGSKADDGSFPSARDAIQGYSSRFSDLLGLGAAVTNAKFNQIAAQHGYGKFDPPSGT